MLVKLGLLSFPVLSPVTLNTLVELVVRVVLCVNLFGLLRVSLPFSGLKYSLLPCKDLRLF